MPAEIDCNESCRENYAAGISYTREHEVKPLVDLIEIMAKSLATYGPHPIIEGMCDNAISLYTNNEGK